MVRPAVFAHPLGHGLQSRGLGLVARDFLSGVPHDPFAGGLYDLKHLHPASKTQLMR